MSRPLPSKTKRRILLAAGLLAALIAALAWAYHADVPAAELEARYATGASQFQDILGSRVHFRDEGPEDLPPLLLIHGTSSSLHTWDGWVERLGDRFRILRLDLPGYGLTGANAAGPGGAGDYSNDYRIRVIERLVESRGIHTLAVAGNSLGGLIAWRYAVAHPDRVAATVLVNAAGAPQAEGTPQPGFRVIDIAAMPVASHLMTKLTPRSMIRRALLQVYADDAKVSEELVERHHLMLLREGNRRAMVEAASGVGREVLPPPADVRQPTLVMWGRQDTWIPVRDAETFHAELPDSELVIYDDAGHVPMEEIPEATATEVADFLTRRFLPTLRSAPPTLDPEPAAPAPP